MEPDKRRVTIAVPADKLGVLESRFQTLYTHKLKRDRRAEYNELVRTLKLLRIIPSMDEVVAVSYGVDQTGELHAYIIGEVRMHDHRQLPLSKPIGDV